MIKDFFTYGHEKGMSYCFGVEKERAKAVYQSAQSIFNSFVFTWKAKAIATGEPSRLDLGEIIYAVLQQDLTEQEEAMAIFALGGFVESLKEKQRVEQFINSL